LAPERNGDSGDSERDRREAESERLVKTAKSHSLIPGSATVLGDDKIMLEINIH
jgi:hypothetical protein